nr:unnamed protein product [Callosobruchus chinensis]
MMSCHRMDRALLLCHCVYQEKRVLLLLSYAHLHIVPALLFDYFLDIILHLL